MVGRLHNVVLDFTSRTSVGTSLGEGWSWVEPSGTWAVGTESVLNLPRGRHDGKHQLTLRLVPMVMVPRVPHQRLRIVLNDTEIFAGVLSAERPIELACDVPAGLVHTADANILTLHHPDAAVPAELVGDSHEKRSLSLRCLSLRIENAEPWTSPLFDTSPACLYIVTGLCLPREKPNLELVRYLQGEDAEILFWLDFKDPADYARVRAEMAKLFPEVFVAAAPRAMWGAPSVVTSVLAAIRYAEANIAGWRQVVICSNRDVPLVERERFVARIAALREFDYCGSRWNRRSSDVLRPDAMQITETPGAPRQYDRYQVRREMAVSVDTTLREICPPDAVRSLKLTTTLFNRYALGIYENIHGAALHLHRLTPRRAADRCEFFAQYKLIAGRQWFVASRRFAEILVSDQVADILHEWFADILIADECFFQSVAQAFEAAGRITAHWENVYWEDANVVAVDKAKLAEIIRNRRPHEILARKEAGLGDYRRYFA